MVSGVWAVTRDLLLKYMVAHSQEEIALQDNRLQRGEASGSLAALVANSTNC
jgi:hypothetical protein